MNKETLKKYLCWLVDKDYIDVYETEIVIDIKYFKEYLQEMREKNLKELGL